jgi:hypothetical protein
VEGEYATQDLYNIFLRIAGEPVMIPRQQIRLIKSVTGRPIEPDDSPVELAQGHPVDRYDEEFVTAPMPEVPPTPTAPVTETPPLPVIEPEPPVIEPEPPVWEEEVVAEEEIDEIVGMAEEPASVMIEETVDSDEAVEADQAVEDDEDEGTFILVPDAAAGLFDDDDDDDQEGGTLLLNRAIVAASAREIEEPEEEYEHTVMLDQEFELPLFPEEDFDDELEMTMMLGDDIELPELLPVMSDDIATQAPEERILATLTCTDGPHAGDVFPVKIGPATIGRSVDNHVPLSRDKEISRRHALIMSEPGIILLQDQNSLNGTYVNNKQISGQYTLQDGDMILVGVSTLRFER